MAFHPVTVVSKRGECSGIRAGDVLAYDWMIPSDRSYRPAPETIQRIYVLVDEGVQLQQPFWLNGRFEGWWYVDMVRIDDRGDTVQVADAYVDFIVPPNGPGYKLIDLEELGEALAEGKLTAAETAEVLVATQAFVDRHLQQPQGFGVGDWRDFPPAALDSLT